MVLTRTLGRARVKRHYQRPRKKARVRASGTRLREETGACSTLCNKPPSNARLTEQRNDLAAYVRQLLLDLDDVFADEVEVVLVGFLVLDRGEDFPAGPPRTDYVLVCN